jgi:hypothetical protein
MFFSDVLMCDSAEYIVDVFPAPVGPVKMISPCGIAR